MNGWSLSTPHCPSAIIPVNVVWHWNSEDGNYQALAKVKCLLGSARLKFTCRLPVLFRGFLILSCFQMSPCCFLGILKITLEISREQRLSVLQSNLKIQTIKKSYLWSRREFGVSCSLPMDPSEVSKIVFKSNENVTSFASSHVLFGRLFFEYVFSCKIR